MPMNQPVAKAVHHGMQEKILPYLFKNVLPRIFNFSPLCLPLIVNLFSLHFAISRIPDGLYLNAFKQHIR
jgi:hypothetical protein